MGPHGERKKSLNPVGLTYHIQTTIYILKYFLVVYPKQQSKGLEKNDQYRKICRKLEGDKFPAEVAFLSVC